MKLALAIGLTIALLAPAASLRAQGMAPPMASMSDNPCPPPAPHAPPEIVRAMLEPGAKPPAMAGGGPGDPGLQAYLKKHVDDMLRDFADRCSFKPANARAATLAPPRVVLMGDSITEGWEGGDPSLFGNAVLDRGIGGQTSPQMLLRFYQDVVALHPRAVHIMAGTNNIAGNTGPTSAEDFENDIRAMVDLAQANHIKVILASIPPSDHFPWRADLAPAPQIRTLNAWLRGFAAERHLVYADYYSALTTPAGAMKPELTNDGVHPNINGYAIMRPIFERAIRDALPR